MLLGVFAAGAYEIEYAADRPAELATCDAARYRGQDAEANDCYRRLLAANDDVRITAEAARALGDHRGANAFFQTALRDYADDPAVRTRWGNLFSATHQDNEAVKLYQEALGLAPDYVPAIIGLARISAGRFDEQAREWVEDALEIEPDSIAAHVLLARMALEEGDADAADASLDRALRAAEARDVAPLEIYALKAAADLLRGVEDGEWTAKALAYNPGYGEIHATPAYFYVITRRYREAIALYQKAVTIEPDLYSAHAELGVNLLRENKIAEAQQHLAIAYRGDPYSARIVNTLRLIDSFDNFVVNRFGKALDGDSPDPGVMLRLHKDEAPVIERYVLDLVNRSIDVYTKRYGFELQEPAIVELYPDHDDFAVRTSGLPGIGLLGVAFGYLVAMDSPSGRAEGDFHWGTTLWHEMAHIFTLKSTNHLVPRWFSEGVSVYEEWSTGPLPGRHLPVNVLVAIRDDKLLPVAELDRGFIRPSYPDQVIVSYMQAGLTCQYIAASFGQQALEKMLNLYRDGVDTPGAIEGALGISAEQFDARFAEFVTAELGPIVAGLERWQEAQASAHQNAEQGQWIEALAAAERAIDLNPDYVDQGSAYLIRAKAQEQVGTREAAVASLRDYHGRGGHDPIALIRLGRWLAEAGERTAAIDVFEDVLLVAPLNEAVHAELGDWLLAEGRAEQALAEYEALFAMQPHDQAAAHFRLARAYSQLDDLPRAREHLLYALEIAPHYREAQQLLLEIVR
jgi:tetratricopeptide (TPR) repeat protein